MFLAQLGLLVLLAAVSQAGVRRVASWVTDITDWVLLGLYTWFLIKYWVALFRDELDFGWGFFREELVLVTVGLYVAHAIVRWADLKLRGRPSDFERAKQWLYSMRAQLA